MDGKNGIGSSPCCPGSLARACIPSQIMNQIYSPREALKKGTLFPELYNPDFTTGIGDTDIGRGGRYCE